MRRVDNCAGRCCTWFGHADFEIWKIVYGSRSNSIDSIRVFFLNMYLSKVCESSVLWLGPGVGEGAISPRRIARGCKGEISDSEGVEGA